MRKRILSFLTVFLISLSIPFTAFADIGPKASVNIEFIGVESDEYYVTLLAEEETTGPYSVADENKGYSVKYHPEDEGYNIWLKFKEYKDKDNFNFLQYFEECSAENEFSWTYRAPNTYKILVYFPDENFFASSQIYENYAFDSYYKVDMSNVDISENGIYDGLVAKKNYDYTWEIVSLLVRIVLTVAIEIGIAYIFGWRKRRELKVIAGVNIFTQVLLNILLNIANYKYGYLMFIANYIWMEILVVAIEFAVFVRVLPKISEKQRNNWYILSFSLVANIVSFALGMWLSTVIPGIF